MNLLILIFSFSLSLLSFAQDKTVIKALDVYSFIESATLVYGETKSSDLKVTISGCDQFEEIPYYACHGKYALNKRLSKWRSFVCYYEFSDNQPDAYVLESQSCANYR